MNRICINCGMDDYGILHFCPRCGTFLLSEDEYNKMMIDE